jgi:hypothetical protein
LGFPFAFENKEQMSIQLLLYKVLLSLSKESKHQCFYGNIMNYISNKIFLLHPEEQDSLHYALVENHRRVIFPNHTLFSTKSCSTRG